MTIEQKREREIDRLLHDAEHADSGAMMATTMRDFPAAKEFEAKRRRLINAALKLDPNREANAWSETTLEIPSLNSSDTAEK